MKANRKSIGVAATLIGVFVLGFVSHDVIQTGGSALLTPARAADGTNCSVRTLNGAYGVKFEGSAVDKGQYASVSRMTFDGRGTFTISEIGRFNGEPVDRTFTGPYVVNADCSSPTTRPAGWRTGRPGKSSRPTASDRPSRQHLLHQRVGGGPVVSAVGVAAGHEGRAGVEHFVLGVARGEFRAERVPGEP
jgi:hypothetical protein